MNSFLISLKRKSYVKAEKNLEKAKENANVNYRKEAENKYKQAYQEYLESVDKYIMDSIYAKVRTEKANKVEKKALADYYKINKIKKNNTKNINQKNKYFYYH